MSNKPNIISLNPFDFSSELYSNSDEALLTPSIEENQFDPNTDYVEFIAYDLNNNQIYPGGENLSFVNYSIINNDIYINPEEDLNLGSIDTGTVNVLYNFFTPRLSSNPQNTYYISEISSDRTEIRLESNIISSSEVITSTSEFISYREQDTTFPDFYLNFGSNNLLIANNILLDTDNTVLIKLYEPLPLSINLKTSLWVVEKISNGLAYRVEFNNIITLPSTNIQIKGPNYNIANKTELNNSTEETNLNSFTSPNSQSEYQLNSYFNDPSVNINVDYTDFNNFVNFSSAKARIENFWYKVGLIESASEQIASQSAFTQNSYISSSLSPFNNLINDTITNFDRFEYYLYFESGSNTYPKTNSIPPYENALTGSADAISWYDTQIISASDYDLLNQDWLYYAIPEYLRNDSSNDQYFTFINMIGQFTDDNIWAYLRDTTNKWDADNRINAGVSKDLVAQVLRDMGVQLYQNNFSSTDLYSAFLGFTDSGSLFPFPYMTGSVESSPGILDTPDGYEYITNFISSSNEAIPLDDINKRIYKRIYHNLPYLLKAKGTVAGLRTLITSYGIPDTILRISEFGGKDKINTNDWDLWQHQYNFQYDTNNDGEVSSAWNVNTDWKVTVPQTVQFRFKAPKSGSNAVDNAVTNRQQVLWSLQSAPEIAIGLDYFGDGFTSGSYSGSVPSQSFEYANLVFTTDNFNTTSSVYLPFFDGEWWSVALTKENDDFTLYAGDKIYEGNDGSQIGFIGSASFNVGGTDWDNAPNSFFPSNTRSDVGAYSAFSGSYQEIRYFNQAISQSVFKDYVMNPQSTEGNGVNGSETQLLFRASLGGELYTGSESIHPKYSSNPSQSSFPSNNSSFIITNGSFNTNREYIFYDSPPVGIKNRNTDKIKRQNLILPPGNTENTGSLGVNVLSNLGTIQQSSFITDDYTNNLNLLEVAFSPQNEINDDIINQIGFFNVGDYIGDPRLISSSADTYPSLVELSKQYFEKYTSSYDVYDYIRLIKFFDNSLFKMIKDYVPVRTGLASGIVVKQHILERQKYPTPQLDWTKPEYTGSIGSTPALIDGNRYYKATTDYESIPIVTTEGGAGGSVNDLNVPVGFLRAVDTSVPNTNITSTPTTLFTLGTLVMGIVSGSGVNVIQDGLIDNVSGEFTINSDYTFKGDIAVEIRNNADPGTFTLNLVEKNVGTLNTITKTIPVVTAPDTNTLTLINCILEKGKTYSFTLTCTTTVRITGVTRLNFVQQDAPLTFRSGQMYSEVIKTPLGDVTETISNSHEFYDGEYSGSDYVVTNGELNPQCDFINKADTTAITFDVSSGTYNVDGLSDFVSVPSTIQLPFTPGNPSFTNTVKNLSSGALNLYWESTRVKTSTITNDIYTDTYQLGYIGISKTSKNGIDVADSISNTTEFTLLTDALAPVISRTYAGYTSVTSTASTLKLNVISIKEYANSYLIQVTTPSVITLVSTVTAFATAPAPYPVVVPSQGDIEVIQNPYFNGDFANDNCNPLMNNATDITPSTIYYDVDYANNPNVAVNFAAILSGSAPKAKIQDYNYYARRSIIPRYEGSENTSDTYNVIDGAIDATQAYFAYFNWVGGTSPEWGNGLEDRSVANLRFFLDVNGKIIKPIADSQGINQGIVENNFTEGKIATLAFDDENGSSAGFANLAGDHTIFKSGKDITPIVYSQTASIAPDATGGYTSSLFFVQGDQQENSAVGDYRLTAFSNGSQLLNEAKTVQFGFQQYLGSLGTFTGTNTTYSTQTTAPNTVGVSIEFKAKLEPELNIPGATVTFQWKKNTDLVGGTVQVDFGNSSAVFLSYTDNNVVNTDTFKLEATSVTYGRGDQPSLSNNSFFKAIQTPPPGLGAINDGQYWEKLGVIGSAGAAQFKPLNLLAVYGQKQEDITGSGFFGITNDFILQVGDEIRFQGTETQTYKITAVDNLNAPPIFTVDRGINLTNDEMDWFLVRRYVDNPANIILEVDKTAGGTSPGILKPQFLSRNAEDNIDTILEDLRRDSLI